MGGNYGFGQQIFDNAQQGAQDEQDARDAQKWDEMSETFDREGDEAAAANRAREQSSGSAEPTGGDGGDSGTTAPASTQATGNSDDDTWWYRDSGSGSDSEDGSRSPSTAYATVQAKVAEFLQEQQARRAEQWEYWKRILIEQEGRLVSADEIEEFVERATGASASGDHSSSTPPVLTASPAERHDDGLRSPPGPESAHAVTGVGPDTTAIPPGTEDREHFETDEAYQRYLESRKVVLDMMKSAKPNSVAGAGYHTLDMLYAMVGEMGAAKIGLTFLNNREKFLQEHDTPQELAKAMCEWAAYETDAIQRLPDIGVRLAGLGLNETDRTNMLWEGHLKRLEDENKEAYEALKAQYGADLRNTYVVAKMPLPQGAKQYHDTVNRQGGAW